MPDKALATDQITANRRAMEPVKNLLKQRGYNQRFIAESLGVSEATVSKWLQGKQNIMHSQFLAIMTLLGAKPDEMYGGPEDQARASRYKALATLVGGMNDAQLDALEAVARQLAPPRKP